MWMYGWMPLGFAAFALVIVNLFRAALGKHRGWRALLAASLSCGGLAAVCAFLEINRYIQQWNVSSLLDVAPTLAVFSAWGVCLGIALNLLALRFHTQRDGKSSFKKEM